MMRALTLLAAICCGWSAFAYEDDGAVVQPAAVSGPSYLVSEDGTGTGWTDINTPTWTGTAWTSNAATDESYITFAEQAGIVHAFHKVTWSAITGSPWGLNLKALDGTDLCRVVCLSTGALRVYHGTTNAATSAGVYTAGNEICIWIDYTPGTGVNGVAHLYFSADETKPGSPSVTINNGNGMGLIARASLRSAATIDTTIKKVRVDNETIGSNPP